MPKIFISYRHEDSEQHAKRIWDRLKDSFVNDPIYFDMGTNEGGSDYREDIQKELEDADVMIAVIGPNWLTVEYQESHPKAGEQRITDSKDTLRNEIETALDKNIRIIPVLVGGAAMPTANMLPPSLKDFSYKHAHRIHDDPDFDHTVSRLVQLIKKSDASQPNEWLGIVVLIILVGGLVFWLSPHGGNSQNTLGTAMGLLDGMPTDPNDVLFLNTLMERYRTDLQPDRLDAILYNVVTNPAVSSQTVGLIADFYRRQKNWTKTDAVLTRLVQVSSNSPEAWYNLAKTKAILTNSPEARVALRRSLQLNAERPPTDPDAQELLRKCRDETQFSDLLREPEFINFITGNLGHSPQ